MDNSKDPNSTRSSASGSRGVSESPPRLDANTLALLDSFLSSKAEEERKFHALAEEAAARLTGAGSESQQGGDAPMMSVDEFKAAFGEDWQLSQFWYSAKFATQLSKLIRSLCSETSIVAFLCCPTAFVGFQHTNPLPGARLLEYDQRFDVLSPTQYIRYDIDEPDNVPSTLIGKVDVVVADPPFLNEATNLQLTQTLRIIMRPNAKLILLTSTSVRDVLDKLYIEPPLGPLVETALKVEHGQLANDFKCWGSWEGAANWGLS